MTWDSGERRRQLRAVMSRTRTMHTYPVEALQITPTLPALPPAPDWEETRLETPTGRTVTAAADVAVPAMQAGISGVIAAAAVMVARGAGLDVSVWAVAGAGVGVAGLAWSVLLSDGRRLLRSIEVVTRAAPPEASTGGKQAAAGETVRVEVHEDRGATSQGWALSDLPIARDQLAAICRRVDSGAWRLSTRDLAELPGVGRDKARAVLGSLEAHGFVAYPNGRNHPSGAVWTARGRALVRALIG